MAKGVSLIPVPYVLQCDRNEPEEKQTKFMIRALTSSERADVKNHTLVTEVSMLGPKHEGQGVARMNSGKVELMYVRYGLVAMKNYSDSEGKLVEFDENSKKDHKELCIEVLAADHLAELATEIINRSSMTKVEQKN